MVDLSMSATIKNGFPKAAAATKGEIAKQLRAAGDRAVKLAQSRAKVRTGMMRDYTMVTAATANSVTVSAQMPYSGFLDQGTRYIAADHWFSGAIDQEGAEFIVELSIGLEHVWGYQ